MERPIRVVTLMCTALLAHGQAAQIPVLHWEARSDWMNVREAGAVGDGIADDTGAIQAVFDRTPETETNYAETLRHRVVYFPPGRYRLTQTLTLVKSHGLWLVGHGRDTVLEWDGAAQGVMLWNNGATYTRYEGLSWDGRGKASVGVEHKSMHYYETAMRYQDCAFAHCTEHGVLVGRGDEKVATAEMWFRNCLFRNCGNGVSFRNFNDYDNTFDGCQFEECGVGLNSEKGNFYVRACGFEGSRECDVQQLSPSHASSLRFCTSQGSKRFFRTMRFGHLAMKIQNCLVDGWTASDGAIQLGHRGPTTLFDCGFTNPPGPAAPVSLCNPADLQALLIVSANASPGTRGVVDPGPNSRITEIPAGKRRPVLSGPFRRFLSDAPRTSPRLFDAMRDFGARADGSTDDTAAVQACLDAARAHGQGAMGYLPGGVYRITQTLQMAGGDFGIGGTGFRSILTWGGEKSATMLRVHHPRNLRLEHLVLQGSPETVRIHQTAEPGASSIVYDGVYVNGLDPCRTGLWLDRLPPGAVVLMGHLIGNLRLSDCGPATVLCAQHYYSLTLEGATQPKTGLAGFMFHNDACHNYALDVLDNQDVIVADFYSESNRRYLLAEGREGQGSGRITIGASKISTVDREAMTVRNYQGRIFVGGGDGWWQTDMSQAVELVHEGTRPVDFTLAGQMWWAVEPVRRFGPGLRYASIENLLMENRYPEYNQKSLPNVSTPTTQACLTAALDDFRELGAAYMSHFFPAGAPGPGEAVRVAAPYPPSPAIADVEFDFATHRRLAEGSDNWPTTWADDGHLYTAWGDGGGFGGSNSAGRVSLGVARIEGGASDCTGHNVWGGLAGEHPAQFEGKSYGLLCVDGVLTMWVAQQPNPHLDRCQLAWSRDHGATWQLADWSFSYADGLTVPTFLNFGRDYADARDSYVYSYFIHPTWGPGKSATGNYGFDVHKPGRVYLARVPQEAILDRSRYEFCAGLAADGTPLWSAQVPDKRPVFEDPNGVGWNLSVGYNPGLRRYLLATEHGATHVGRFGLFDAPEPWGPWTTVAYDEAWGEGHVEVSAFYWSFPTRWLSPDGTQFTLVFTGKNSNDSWNAVNGRFVLAGGR